MQLHAGAEIFPWLRRAQGVLRCVTEQSRVVRLPAHIHDAAKRIAAARAALEGRCEGGGEPSDAEVAATLGLTASKVQFYRKVRALFPSPPLLPPCPVAPLM